MQDINKISLLVKQQFPSFYQEDGPKFIAFVEAYYRFLEDSEALKNNRNMLNIIDIDKTLDEFIIFFKEKYLKDFPFISATDKRFMIKHIFDYYKSKGTIESTKLLFKLLFNENVDVFMPSENVIKPSSSKWFEPRYIEVNETIFNNSFLNKEITGNASKARAFVEGIVKKRINQKFIDVMFLSNVRGNFQTNETVTIDGNLDGRPIIVGSLSDAEVVLGGKNNNVGDIFEIISDNGVQGKIKVTEVTDGTGLINFNVIDGGFGFTEFDENNPNSENSKATKVLVSDIMAFVDNPNLSFIDLEKVEQKITKLALLSSETLNQNVQIGDEIFGLDSSNNVIAEGVIVNHANTDGDSLSSNIIFEDSANSHVTVQVNSGSFSSQFDLTLSSNSEFIINEVIEEESSVEIEYENLIGTLTVGEKLIQKNISKIGSDVFGLTSTLDNSSNIISVNESTVSLFIGQRLIKTGGVGDLQPFTRIKRIIDLTNIEVDKIPSISGNIIFDAISEPLTISISEGIIQTSNSTHVTLNRSWGDFNTETIITNLDESVMLSPINTNNVFKGAIGTISANNNNVITLFQDSFKAFTVGKYVRGNVTNFRAEIVDIENSGAINVLSANTIAVISDLEVQNISGILVGQNTSMIGLHGNTEPLFFAPTLYTTKLHTNRSSLLNPPRNSNNDIIEITVDVIGLDGGQGADFKIGDLSFKETVLVTTDFLKDSNVAGIPYLDIKLSGENSGIGFVESFDIVNGGSGYAQNEEIVISGGGFNGSDNPTIRSTARISSVDANGSITEIVVDNSGSGYFSTPTYNINTISGVNADLSINMRFAYGFPKLPVGNIENIIADLLDEKQLTIGTINLLKSINPGIGYTVNPFIKVINESIFGLNRKDILLFLAPITNDFKVGERINQIINGNVFFKGIVKEFARLDNVTLLILNRKSLSVTFEENIPIIGENTNLVANIIDFIEFEPSSFIGNNANIVGISQFGEKIASKLQVINSGFGYIPETVNLFRKESPFVITAKLLIEKDGSGEGNWLTENSLLNSSSARIHDNDFYQDYSYDIRSRLSLDKFKDILIKTLHVSGTKMFGNVVNNSSINNNIEVEENSGPIIS